eukprot:g28379.t1
MSAYYTERRRPKGDARLASILELLGRLDASGTGTSTDVAFWMGGKRHAFHRQRLVALISSLVPEMTPQSIDLLMDSSMHADQVNVRYSDFLAWLFEGLGRAGPSLPGAISVATWNVAAVNNNPFEYWLAHDDPCYVNLMVAIETCLSSPSPSWDVPVREIFTEGMFQELKALMLEHDIAGVEEVEESMWREDLQKRRVVSEFIKDKSLGSKRLISMPDRITNTVQVVTRAASEYKPPPACRPTVINNYLGDLSTLEVWWDSWKRFMFCQPLAVRSHQGISVRLPCHMLEPIPRSKYPALSEKEERHHCSPDGTWQVVKSQIGDHLYRCKAQRTMEILETKYSTVDVVFLQEVASNFCDFFQRSALAQSFTCVLPRSMDGKRDQNSLLLLSTQFFEPQIQDVTSVIEESMEDGVRLVSSDLVAVLAKGRDQRSYLLASFHGDTAGRMTLPLLRALVSAAAQRYPRHILIPQLNKAISYKDCVSQSDRNPKDLKLSKTGRMITFNRQQLRLLSPQEVGQPNPLKDNTGQLHYEESMNFPTFDFPSDHAIVAALLQQVA